MRVLVVTLPEKGHLHPLLAPAQALQARGHEVAFYAPCDLSAPLARAGFARVFAGTPAPPADDNRGAPLAALLRDSRRLRRWIQHLLLDGVPAEIAHLEPVVRDFRPDVIAADPMFYAAPIVAAHANRPWIALSTSLNPVVPPDWTSELIATVEALAHDRDELFADYDVAAHFSVCDCLSRQTNVVFATEALVGAAPPGVTLAGPSLPRGGRFDRGDAAPAFPWHRLDGRPLVYLSFGSQNWYQPRALELVIAASRNQPWQLVASAGELQPASLPDDVVLVPYAPQLDLLQRARAAITHGGANSVMEALAHGVPLLVSPLCNDQPHNARFVAAAGAGVTLALDDASVAQCRAALSALVADGPTRQAAARIGAGYRARDGAAVAADAVESCA